MTLCIIRWVSGLSKAPLRMADMMEEVMDLARLHASFHHIKSANSKVDLLSKEGVWRQSLMIVHVDISSFLA